MDEVVFFLSSFILFQCSQAMMGNETNITVAVLNETDLKNINETSVLRYGHHRTYECQEFTKVYICIMKCLQIGYDIAVSKKDCRCFCFKDKTKAKYFNRVHYWKLPTTRKPYWAISVDSKSKLVGDEYVEIASGEDGSDNPSLDQKGDENLKEPDTNDTDIKDEEHPEDEHPEDEHPDVEHPDGEHPEETTEGEQPEGEPPEGENPGEDNPEGEPEGEGERRHAMKPTVGK